MLLFGKMLDPQPPSEWRWRPAWSPWPTSTGTVTHHSHSHDHDHGHDHDHATAMAPRDPPLKFLINLICPGMVLLSFIFSRGRGVAAFAAAGARCTR